MDADQRWGHDRRTPYGLRRRGPALVVHASEIPEHGDGIPNDPLAVRGALPAVPRENPGDGADGRDHPDPKEEKGRPERVLIPPEDQGDEAAADDPDSNDEAKPPAHPSEE